MCKRSKVILRLCRMSMESSDKEDPSRVTVLAAEEIPNMFISSSSGQVLVLRGYRLRGKEQA